MDNDRGVEKGVKGTCIICNAPCDHIDWQGDLGKIKDFCCWCVPARYITKPVKEWMCDECKRAKIWFDEERNYDKKIIREFLEELRYDVGQRVLHPISNEFIKDELDYQLKKLEELKKE